jgi:integrase
MAVQKRPNSPLLPATVATASEAPAPRALADYVAAATRENTRRSYTSALQHFEHTWGGFLPASGEQIAQYLVAHAEVLAFNTLKQRLAALAHWHQQHGFYDPTRSNTVRQVLKGIRTLHLSVERRAKPLHLKDLAQAMNGLTRAAELALAGGDRATWLRHLRDRALIALGFWRGFRGDELLRLQVEHLQWVDGEGLQCYLPRSKGDRALQGVTFQVPALSVCCPVTATQAWITAAKLVQGALFRRVGRWGEIGEEPLHANSIIRLLRRVLQETGIPDSDAYSAHSLRRGFAAWATADGWDIKALMEYVGWKDLKSALRYLPQVDPFNRERIERALR